MDDIVIRIKKFWNWMVAILCSGSFNLDGINNGRMPILVSSKDFRHKRLVQMDNNLLRRVTNLQMQQYYQLQHFSLGHQSFSFGASRAGATTIGLLTQFRKCEEQPSKCLKEDCNHYPKMY
ncbi:hypothetical protein H5410_053585 [Solanum commersonii]|uniref:Uncharacterized protein n=1 Tax=Solanum commersonii TaxID=4109 RepID=A0A9J5X6U8_SOLCO|nr:hypothetical protein H5410_053585 [Solanum commersonii]